MNPRQTGLMAGKCLLHGRERSGPTLGHVRSAVTPERVENAGNLSCESEDSHAFSTSLLDLVRPLVHWVLLAASPRRPGALDKSPPKGGGACLGDAHATLPLGA